MRSTSTSADATARERKRHSARDEVGRTLESLEDRLILRRKADAASRGFEAASRRMSKWASPQITSLIRREHTQVLATLRRYRIGLSGSRKRALVAQACRALELHMQLEEEVFYPALFARDGETPELNYSIEEHDRMSALIERLRRMSPRDADYDSTYCELIGAAFHHVADEETILLPRAEVRLKLQLRELGLRMSLRRAELLRLRRGEAAMAGATVGLPILAAVATVALGLTVWLMFGRRAPATA